ncbi:MAG: response regulator [Oligoflexia bacterium]|nr:response regulator [Oligoflexia bacterium]
MDPLKDIDRNMPILVVDDLSSMRRIVKNCLLKLGFENVTEAENAEQALAQLENSHFSFVISDWEMQTAEHASLLELARQHEHLKSIPFLVVAPQAHKQLAEHLAHNGHSECIVKPFTAAVLKEKMSCAITKPE